jgi:hypothetical protein
MNAKEIVEALLDEGLPSVGHYAYGRTGRPKSNAMVVTVGDLTVWFSYYTPIAFRKGNAPVVARQNEWGPTTGRHLKSLGVARNRRLPAKEFESALQAAGGGEVSLEQGKEPVPSGEEV